MKDNKGHRELKSFDNLEKGYFKIKVFRCGKIRTIVDSLRYVSVFQGLEFSSHCLDKNLPYMFYLWGEIFARFVLLIRKFLCQSVSVWSVG